MREKVSLLVGRNMEKVRGNGVVFGRDMQCLKMYSEKIGSDCNKLSILKSKGVNLFGIWRKASPRFMFATLNSANTYKMMFF